MQGAVIFEENVGSIENMGTKEKEKKDKMHVFVTNEHQKAKVKRGNHASKELRQSVRFLSFFFVCLSLDLYF